MTATFYERPILNSPYEEPRLHHDLDEDGQPTDRPPVQGRRRSELITPVPKPRKRRKKADGGQAEMVLQSVEGLSSEEQECNPTPIINEIRLRVGDWRRLPSQADWGVTPATARLLRHWRHHEFQGIRPFFCQIEAVETIIWLTEVARTQRTQKHIWDHINGANEQANPELPRLAVKMATGAGKTTVMAMLIAWQTVNAVRSPTSRLFTRGFLVVTPGITIKDRLRVLQPNDPDSYYKSRELVPADMLADINKAKIVITNYHGLQPRELIDASRVGRSLLQGRGEAIRTQETEGQMVRRVAEELMGLKNVLVINDEAHHCYREKPDNRDIADLRGDEKKDAQEENKAARVWINGIEAMKRKLGVRAVYDLSAIPFFLSGSGWAEGTLFPWTVSDFSLMDAIECGIVKLPRVPVTAMRDLLTESGSILVQIGDENVHRVRAILDEVFGEENFISQITIQKTGGLVSSGIVRTIDYILWFSRDCSKIKIRQLFSERREGHTSLDRYNQATDLLGNIISLKQSQLLSRENKKHWHRCRAVALESANPKFEFEYQGHVFSQRWKTNSTGLKRLSKASRIYNTGQRLNSIRLVDDFPIIPITDRWESMQIGKELVYVVQTAEAAVQRCILMTTDPSDLVLDPTCGSGTTATVAEQWGRRWITLDTSRVALALARARLMGARYAYYHLTDSIEGRQKEQGATGKAQPDTPTHNDIRQGFVYERAPHITLKSIANNAEIDVIWEGYQEKLEPLRARLNAAVGVTWEEWEIPREAEDGWPAAAREAHGQWWELRIARQREIDQSIARKAEVELLYDRPYEDSSKVRVAGPFTVESLSPHRMVPADDDELIHDLEAAERKRAHEAQPLNDFTQMVIDNLRSAGVHQAAKDDRIVFTTIEGWPGDFIAAEGRYLEREIERRAAVFIGPEFGTVTRADLTAAAREALDARFDALIACGFNFDAHSSELTKLGPLPILKAKMNPDLHMSEELKNTGAGNLFVVFGEPDIEWRFDGDGRIVVQVLGVDVFDPKTGEVRASGTDDIAAWFIDTDYDEESFFVRQAYFLGAQDPYKALKTSLKAEIDREAWESLYRDTSRPFPRPATGRFAVKVINHFGDEVMKVFGV